MSNTDHKGVGTTAPSEAMVEAGAEAFSNSLKCAEHMATRQGRNADRESCVECLTLALRAALAVRREVPPLYPFCKRLGRIVEAIELNDPEQYAILADLHKLLGEMQAESGTGLTPAPLPVEVSVKAGAVEVSGDRSAGREPYTCAFCERPATCFGSYESQAPGFACDDHCGHGCEDGRCVPASPPPEGAKP
jgi:hypothetical protein